MERNFAEAEREGKGGRKEGNFAEEVEENGWKKEGDRRMDVRIKKGGKREQT